jgi:hypothetical protein
MSIDVRGGRPGAPAPPPPDRRPLPGRRLLGRTARLPGRRPARGGDRPGPHLSAGGGARAAHGLRPPYDNLRRRARTGGPRGRRGARARDPHPRHARLRPRGAPAPARAHARSFGAFGRRSIPRTARDADRHLPAGGATRPSPARPERGRAPRRRRGVPIHFAARTVLRRPLPGPGTRRPWSGRRHPGVSRGGPRHQRTRGGLGGRRSRALRGAQRAPRTPGTDGTRRARARGG